MHFSLSSFFVSLSSAGPVCSALIVFGFDCAAENRPDVDQILSCKDTWLSHPAAFNQLSSIKPEKKQMLDSQSAKLLFTSSPHLAELAAGLLCFMRTALC